MNRKTFVSLAGPAALAAMLGCSTPQAVSPVPEVVDVPPPEVSIDLPLEPPDTDRAPQFCKLGSSCLTMDPRPFEPCLLSTRECRDKVSEPLFVVEPHWIVPPTIIESAEKSMSKAGDPDRLPGGGVGHPHGQR